MTPQEINVAKPTPNQPPAPEKKMKTDPLEPGPRLLCKLASVAVHSDEMLSAKGHAFDRHALQSALNDEEVKGWINQMTEMGMAPVKR